MSASKEDIASSVGSTAADSPTSKMKNLSMSEINTPDIIEEEKSEIQKIADGETDGIEPGKCTLYPVEESGCEGETFGANGQKYWSVKWMGPGCGFGCIADVDIPKHTLIHIEQPILKEDDVMKAIQRHDEEHTSWEDDEKFLIDEVKMPAEQRKKLWLMHDQYITDYEHQEGKRRLWGIIYSNSFENHEIGGGVCLYFLTAKFNHSCSPNISYCFNKWEQRVWTTQDIKKGQEICDCYNDVFCYFEPRSVRQKFFLSKYRFTCCCSACKPVLTEEETEGLSDDKQEKLLKDRIKLSDKRRKRCKVLAQTISQNLGVELYPDVPDEIGSRNDPNKKTKDKKSSEPVKFRSGNAGKKNAGMSKKCTPTTNDLDMLIEFMDTIQKEKADQEMLESYELAYDLAIFLGRHDYLKQYKFGEQCLELYELSKSAEHKKTRKFKAKLTRDAMFA